VYLGNIFWLLIILSDLKTCLMENDSLPSGVIVRCNLRLHGHPMSVIPHVPTSHGRHIMGTSYHTTLSLTFLSLAAFFSDGDQKKSRNRSAVVPSHATAVRHRAQPRACIPYTPPPSGTFSHRIPWNPLP
jgi:hypothetical protein